MEPNWTVVEKSFFEKISTKTHDIIQENVLLLFSCGLLYLDFADAYWKGYSNRIKKCISCFVVIYLSFSNTRYATKMMHMVACFKKLWNSNLKQAWLDYCLINLSERTNKFMANNRFGDRIILLNKKMICPSANALCNEFLRKTMVMNVISF